MHLTVSSFYGFPQHYYQLEYPYHGSKAVAETVLTALNAAGIQAKGVRRDLDHGAWAMFRVGMLARLQNVVIR